MESLFIALLLALISCLLLAFQMKMRVENKNLRSQLEEKETVISDLSRQKLDGSIRYAESQAKLEHLNQLCGSMQEQKRHLEDSDMKLQREVSALQTENRLLKEGNLKLGQEKEKLKEDTQKTYEQLQTILSDKFKTIAQAVMKEKSEEFRTQSNGHLTNLLAPLKMRLEDFNKQVQQSDKERYNLKEQLQAMNSLNLNLVEQTRNLSEALRGNNKIQGSWGEIVLERILEISGLHKNTQFTCQQAVLNNENDILKPDAIVHLPNNRQVIIDAKTSFKSYEIYCNAQDPKAKTQALREFIQSVKRHIRDLSAKKYQELTSINTVDFVVMFIPIEEAFLLAYQDTYQLAWENNIIMASPTTIVPTLRIVHFIWKESNQKENYKRIAHSAGVVHDKICSILMDIKKMKQMIDSLYHKSGEIWEDVNNKKIRGRGGVISHLNELEKMGASVKKEALTENS